MLFLNTQKNISLVLRTNFWKQHQISRLLRLGKSGEPDPDPLPYLVVSMEDKRKDQLKTYDPKKSYWVPDGKGGYCESMLVDDDGKKATVMCGHEVS